MVKILSNFDTEAPTKNYAEAVQEYSFDKVVFLRRHKLYFIMYTFIPVGIAIFLLAGLLYSLIVTDMASDVSIIANRSTQIVLFLLAAYLLLIGWSRYFNYILDYTIITPKQISSYNQTGLFSRQIRTIEPEKIKTIDFSSKGFINSVFNFGEVSILLEGDETGQGEIYLDFIANPEEVKQHIRRITQDTEDQEDVEAANASGDNVV